MTAKTTRSARRQRRKERNSFTKEKAMPPTDDETPPSGPRLVTDDTEAPAAAPAAEAAPAAPPVPHGPEYYNIRFDCDMEGIVRKDGRTILLCMPAGGGPSVQLIIDRPSLGRLYRRVKAAPKDIGLQSLGFCTVVVQTGIPVPKPAEAPSGIIIPKMMMRP